ncbi:MAG TPA: DUF1330 domain-containing protein [Vicinamibacterales bacterium]|nr:DUF1330 domain-containing protein [Vicinamibacterales bacterium]
MNRRAVVVIGLILVVGAGLAVASQAEPKKAYVVVQVDVSNPQQYQDYAKLSPRLIAKFGGRFLARAGRTITLEGPPAKSRVVVLEFPSFERAEAFYHSPEYVAARKLREGAATAQLVLVEGME